MRWLALDVGAERVGVAVSDPAEGVVTCLPAIPFRGAEKLAVKVLDLCAQRQVEGVVVGLPRTVAGVGRGGARVEAVVTALEGLSALPVELQDERGTTHEARARLLAAGVSQRRWAELVDSAAAAVILERHLAQRAIAGGHSSPFS